MNKLLAGPIAAILYLLFDRILYIHVDQSALQTTIEVIMTIIAGIGIFMHPSKPPKE